MQRAPLRQHTTTTTITTTTSSDGGGNTGSSTGSNTGENTGCFSLSNYVTMYDFSQRLICDLKIGDRVLSMDSLGNMAPTVVIENLDFQKYLTTQFLEIVTENEMSIVLTENHLIYERQKGYIKAKYIEINDELNIISTENSTSSFSRVKSVEMKVEEGFTAPLTESGTLIVNGIHASCYTINSHTIAHIAMKPLVYWFKLKTFFGQVYSETAQDGKHSYLRFLKHSGLKSFADILF